MQKRIKTLSNIYYIHTTSTYYTNGNFNKSDSILSESTYLKTQIFKYEDFVVENILLKESTCN